MILRAFIWLFFFGFCSCDSPRYEAPVLFSQNIMTIDYRILVGHPLNNNEKQQIEKIIQKTFHEIDSIYNKWNPRSEISLLNNLEEKKIHKLSPQLYHFLQLVDEYVKMTEGRFDPTIEPLQQLWKSHFAHKTVPSHHELEEVKAIIGWEHIHFDKGLFYKDHSLVKLDLGGVAKGFCVDLLLQRLNEAGFQNAFIEWGGEIAVTGEHPEGRPWQIYISAFENTEYNQAIATLPLSNQAIATSGNYLQTWKLADGTIYSHIFDPKTLFPIRVTPESIASASVVAQDCATADVLATTLMLFNSPKEASEWIEKIKEKEVRLKYWVLSRGE